MRRWGGVGGLVRLGKCERYESVVGGWWAGAVGSCQKFHNDKTSLCV